MKPESLMMSHGYAPELSEGAIKPPVFHTSTFVFHSAEEGKAYFQAAYGLNEPDEQPLGLIYSRINNPNLQIFEERLCLWDKAEECAVFSSGMAAISTLFLEFLKPGDLLLYSTPTYGGTDHLINGYLNSRGVLSVSFRADMSFEEIKEKVISSGYADRLALIFIETPANPTNELIDILLCRKLADHFSTKDQSVLLTVDNTYMGPVWCQPIKHGADLIVYSATKYIGGHSDLIAGAISGNRTLIERIKTLRTFLGNIPGPQTAWLLTRSLETLKIRMDKQCANAIQIASYLAKHPVVHKVNYLGLLDTSDPAYAIYTNQYTAPGAMISFEVRGGEAAAFRFMNSLHHIQLAVSLGGTESLVQHPDTMTHAAVDTALKRDLGITSGLVRLSVGIEYWDDLIQDIGQALDNISIHEVMIAG